MKFKSRMALVTVVRSGPARALGIEISSSYTPFVYVSSGPARALGIEIGDLAALAEKASRGLRGPWGLKCDPAAV